MTQVDLKKEDKNNIIIMHILKLENEKFNVIKENMLENLGIEKLQLYYPILSLYFNYYNNDSFQRFTLKSPKFIQSINSKLENKYEDSYIKNMFNCSVFDTRTGNVSNDKDIFIKILPVLDMMSYMKNDYKTCDPNLPNIYNYLTNKKINSYHNNAYIDNFFTYLGSKLVDLHMCPTFPEYFGSFTGIANSFDFDITEEYNELKRINWFQNGLDKRFFLKQVENKKVSEYLSEMNNLEFTDPDSESNNDTDKNVHIRNEIDIDNLEELLGEDIEDSISNHDSFSESETGSNVNSESDNISIKSFNSDISFDDSLRYLYYITVNKFPVQLVCLEKLEATLDNLIENGYDICEREWKSILFQICFGLSVAQKNYEFVHNDLHSSNIMFKETADENIYFRYKNKYFRLPTYGKVTKIIDFGRATFKVKNQIFFSDVFKKNGDAEGQYTFPYNNTLKDCKIKPNRSFDLSRLATTIIEHFSEESSIYKLLKLWCTDKNGKDLMEFNDDFNLYKLIAKNVISAVPVKQLEKKIFQEFLIKKEDIPKNSRVYYY